MGYVTAVFPSAISSAFKPAFTEASDFWNQVIVSGNGGFSFPSTTNANDFCGVNFVYQAGDRIEGLDIFAVVEPIDGPGSILGSAGPCALIGNFPLLGLMRFDSADAQGLLNGGNFAEVIIHEMGHVIGIGTLWTPLVRNPCPVNGRPCTTNPTYTGSNGVQGFSDLGGNGAVPVANTGGGGTLNGHWREDFFVNELMTGFLNSGTKNPLSVMTIKALRDLGYNVNLGAAEQYFIPSEFQRPLFTTDLELVGDIIDFEAKDINVLIEDAAVRDRVRNGRSGEIDIESEYQNQVTGLFVVMILGFMMLAGLMVSFSRSQKKQLLAIRASSPTENPAFLNR